MVSLVGIIDNEDVKKDAEFVDAISSLLDEYQTITIYTKSNNDGARKSEEQCKKAHPKFQNLNSGS